MASVRSSNIQDASGNISVAIPAGTQNNDLMIAHIVNNSGLTIAPPPGWTDIEERVTGNFHSRLCYRVASSEPAGYIFTSGTATVAIVSIKDQQFNPSVSFLNNGQTNASSTTCTAPGVTPTVASSLILLYSSANGTVSASGETIATSAPSFAESYDSSSFNTLSLSCSTGTRPETTATGNGTITLSGSAVNIGHMLAIAPGQTPAPAAPLYLVTAQQQMFPFNLPLFVVRVSLFAIATSLWQNVGKRASTWRNKAKS